jgi:hypothetical protein
MILWVFCAVCMSATVVLSEEYLDDLDLPPIPTIPEEMEVYTDAYAEQDTAQAEVEDAENDELAAQEEAAMQAAEEEAAADAAVRVAAAEAASAEAESIKLAAEEAAAAAASRLEAAEAAAAELEEAAAAADAAADIPNEEEVEDRVDTEHMGLEDQQVLPVEKVVTEKVVEAVDTEPEKAAVPPPAPAPPTREAGPKLGRPSMRDFTEMDVDKSGHLSRDEVKTWLNTQMDKQMQAWKRKHDVNTDGRVLQHEYITKQPKGLMRWTRVDSDGDGHATDTEIKARHTPTNNDLKRFFLLHDSNHDGYIYKDEFMSPGKAAFEIKSELR